jgi:ParB-like nuclease family protein
MPVREIVEVANVVVKTRMRKDLGDIEGLSKSIQENGLINPIVLTLEPDGVHLIAGERRFTALKRLGITELLENEHFKWRDDVAGDEYAKTAIELEENIRRKALSWAEEVIGKQRLLEYYERKYGPPSGGAPSRAESKGLKPQGFGVRKLSEMLGESATQTSQDLELAALITKIPLLQQEPSKDAARRKLDLAMKIATGNNTVRVAAPLTFKILITCTDENHQRILMAVLKGMGLSCQPLVA